MEASSEASRPDLSIVIPCFNEEDKIGQTIETLSTYLTTTLPDVSVELLIVNDGSTDNTLEELNRLAQTHKELKVVSFAYNKGRGAAIKSGLKNSRGERVILLDADLSYDEKHVGEIWSAFEKTPNTDVVVVSAYMKGGLVQGVPFTRLFVSKMANWVLSGFFAGNLSTVTCVVRGYRGDLIRNITLLEDGKELHLEILRKLYLMGANFVEIPGRLVWKLEKGTRRRKTNLRFVGAAKNHFSYAMLVRPTRIFWYIATFFLAIGLYESMTMAVSFFKHYPSDEEDIWVAISTGLSGAFAQSPHTVVIAIVAIILSLQVFFYLGILMFLRLQQEETLRHLLTVLENRK